MRKLIAGMITMMLITASGFGEVIMTAEDDAINSDVVLESAVKEIKSIPRDTVDVIGDSLKYVKDEAETAVNGVKSVFQNDAHTQTQMNGALAVQNAWDSSNDIIFRSYKVSEDIGDLLMAGHSDSTNQAVDVSDFFKGISFPERTSIYYQPEFKSLFARQTRANLLAIENVLSEYQKKQKELMGHQVEIEAKFVEVSQSTLNELGFSWRFNSKDGGDLELFDDLVLPAGQDIFASGLRTASSVFGGTSSSAGLLSVSKSTGSFQWDLLISALEQSNDADLLSAPRVVTLDGSTAVIRVGEERMIPKSFDVNNSDTSPYVEHSDWDLTLMGVYMEVTPEIIGDGLLNIALKPRILDIVGTDSYQVTPAYNAPGLPSGGSDNDGLFSSFSVSGLVTTVTSAVGWFSDMGDKDIAEQTASLPYLRVRELETNVTVADGNTIAMGGLIYDKLETFKDKVPVLGSIPLLGRLFRSEGERSVKRNLMIFVTASQVDIKGQTAAELAVK
jgi:general secretion pathway protein D